MTGTRIIQRVRLALFSALLAMVPGLAAADETLSVASGELYAEQAKSDKVEISIRVVHATSAHSRIDPRLQNLTKYLSHLKYTGYELLQTHTAELGESGKQTFTIEGGFKVTIELLAKEDSRVRMRVVMARGSDKLLDTTLSVNRNGTFIVAGPKHQGGILVLPLTARY
jgi:hypothetical protein